VIRDVVLGAPLDRARVVAIVLHGRNQDPPFMAEHVVQRLALPDVAYVVPAADERSWYPASFMAPLADNEPKLSQALARVAQLADDLARPHVVIGFSQGACLACEHVYKHRGQTRALIAFTGGLIGPPGTTWRLGDELAGMPALISGATHDPFVPAERMRATAAALIGLGARVATKLFDGDDHAVRDAEIAAARALLMELIA
jgi:phospholipase/carboxylesterase